MQEPLNGGLAVAAGQLYAEGALHRTIQNFPTVLALIIGLFVGRLQGLLGTIFSSVATLPIFVASTVPNFQGSDPKILAIVQASQF